ncbi:MAG: Uncharacterised protein [Glaciecola sp. HTCC2999]|nr:MAG: Uncharacterised protein [Glaciecola sp. HTCC2999]
MSPTEPKTFECPYCMVMNDVDVDVDNDVGQQQIVDCQICCSPIELLIQDSDWGLEIIAKRDDE